MIKDYTINKLFRKTAVSAKFKTISGFQKTNLQHKFAFEASFKNSFLSLQSRWKVSSHAFSI